MPRSFYKQRGPIRRSPKPGSTAAIWTRAYSPNCTLAVCVGDVEDEGRLIAVFELDGTTPTRAEWSISLVVKRLTENGWLVGLEEPLGVLGRELFERAQNLEIVEMGGYTWEA
jgi:hypothetical protein